jgi:hypothetical protein
MISFNLSSECHPDRDGEPSEPSSGGIWAGADTGEAETSCCSLPVGRHHSRKDALTMQRSGALPTQ